MPSFTVVIGSVFAFLAIVAGAVFIFGLPKEVKRELENKALDTMGENKASYMMKDAIGGIPESDQQEIKDLKKGVSNLAGGALQNPLGKAVGQTADEGTRDFTGR